jgi:hypothetical protein
MSRSLKYLRAQTRGRELEERAALLLVVEVESQQVARSDLRSVVDNKLVVELSCCGDGTPLPIGITQPLSSWNAPFGSGWFFPMPYVDWCVLFGIAVSKNAALRSFMLPNATSHSMRMPVVLSEDVKQ